MFITQKWKFDRESLFYNTGSMKIIPSQSSTQKFIICKFAGFPDHNKRQISDNINYDTMIPISTVFINVLFVMIESKIEIHLQLVCL